MFGSSVGTKEEMDELLEMAARGEIQATVKVYELERLGDVLQMIKQNKVAGRVVVRIPE